MEFKETDQEWQDAADGFAAIGAGPRLQILRLLLRAEPNGLTVSDIRSRSGIAASTLAHHLRVMTEAGIVRQTRNGRSVTTRADYEKLRRLAGFLLDECCTDSEGTDENE